MARSSLLRLTAFFIAALVLLLVPPGPTFADQPPRVFAFYYAWFDENSWAPQLLSDLPAQPYVSHDPSVIARQIDQAQAAGIDSFVVSWLGPGNPTDDHFKQMLDLAGGKGFSATIDFEAQQYGSADAIIRALTYVRDILEPHGTFARVNGKPILFFWREQYRSVDEWAAIRQAVDPNHNQIWIAEGVNISYQRVFDGHHLYSIAWSPNVNYTLSDWARRVRSAGPDKLWVATVMPGYDDTRTSRPDRFARARDGGNYYRAAWNAAIASHPDLVVITSFNEWIEGSMIEPSASYGNLYLDLTRGFADQFRSQPNLTDQERAAAAATSTPRSTAEPTSPPVVNPTRGPTHSPTPTPVDMAAYRSTGLLRVRSGPGTQYDILAQVPENFVFDVLARSQDSKWLAIAYPDAGSLGWVSAQFVTPPDGLDQFPVEPAPNSAEPVTRDAPAGTNPYDDLPPWY